MPDRARIRAILIPGLSAGILIGAVIGGGDNFLTSTGMVGMRSAYFGSVAFVAGPAILFVAGFAAERLRYRADPTETGYMPGIPYAAGFLGAFVAICLMFLIEYLMLPVSAQNVPPFIPPDIPGRLAYTSAYILFCLPVILPVSCVFGLCSWIGGECARRTKHRKFPYLSK